MTKAPMPTEMSKEQSDNTKSSITQRMCTDLGRSVGVNTATRLVLLIGLQAQLSQAPPPPKKGQLSHDVQVSQVHFSGHSHSAGYHDRDHFDKT